MKKNHIRTVKKQNDLGAKRKLTLHRETLRRLMDNELRLAIGGVDDDNGGSGDWVC